MARINTYLTFNGNCREAMVFYHSILGGDLFLQTISESPMSNKMPTDMKDLILHSTLIKGEMKILASDMVGEKGLIRGNAVSLMLDCDSETDIQLFYEKLSERGQTTHPLETTFWGALFGDLTDKFGIQWLLHFDKTKVSPQ
ncbi:MAG: VOC family protein [Saprospiraceae bacterium]|nr:VOC family protein [Saprospiraceae bacterium]